MSEKDLTRWNRAGLSRFDYLDGNAAVFLEKLRKSLIESFPEWNPVPSISPPSADEDNKEEEVKAYLEALYAADSSDMLWQLTRHFARSCHVLGAHLDAYANESYLGTASQWENLRRLVALLNYAPRPPVSAKTPLALLVKKEKRGTVAAGLQVQHSPASGPPLVFETLAELEVDAAFNVLHAQHRSSSQKSLEGGTSLKLEGRWDKVRIGQPLVLEKHPCGSLSAHIVKEVSLADDQTTLEIWPEIPSTMGFVKGRSIVHLCPKERLQLLGPSVETVDTNRVWLEVLPVDPIHGNSLQAEETVVILFGKRKEKKCCFVKIKQANGHQLHFEENVNFSTLEGATVARPVKFTVDSKKQAVGDWSHLANQQLAGIMSNNKLSFFQCNAATYHSVDETVDRMVRGRTTLTLSPSPDLAEFTELLAPPIFDGPWPIAKVLKQEDNGRLPRELSVARCKQTAEGDLAVMVADEQLAWTRLDSINSLAEQCVLTADQRGWEKHGAAQYVVLGQTLVHAHFMVQAKVLGWNKNDDTLNGKRIFVNVPLAGMKKGRPLIVANGKMVVESAVANVSEDGSELELRDALPVGTTADNLKIFGNVVAAGHGEARTWRVLGSGDGTRSNQSFVLEVDDLAFVPDVLMNSGVRAAVDVVVAGETWTQVGNLKDSGPSDAHYQVRINEDGNAVIGFGDGRHGRRLSTGSSNVRIRFRQGTGIAGNLPAGSLVGLVQPHPLLDGVLQPLESSGGNDREGRSDLRRSAPASLLALDRGVSLEDYAQMARSHPSIWQARAFACAPSLGRREQLKVVVMAAGGGLLSEDLKKTLQEWLTAQSHPGVVITVSDYEQVLFTLKVSVRVRSLVDNRLVKNAVSNALSAAFSAKRRQIGQTLYRGEIYNVVDQVPNVENSSCSIVFEQKDKSGIRTSKVDKEIIVLSPSAHQCLVFDHAKLEFAIQGHEETLA